MNKVRIAVPTVTMTLHSARGKKTESIRAITKSVTTMIRADKRGIKEWLGINSGGMKSGPRSRLTHLPNDFGRHRVLARAGPRNGSHERCGVHSAAQHKHTHT